MKKLLAVSVLIAALVVSSGALAQSQARAPAPVADPGYQTRLALANQLIEVNGGRKQMETLMSALLSTPMKSLAASMPEEQRPLMDKIAARQQKMMTDLLPTIIDISTRTYASTFSEQELKDLLAFQESPSGQAMTRKMPQVQTKMMAELMPVIIQQMPQMMKAVVVDVCNEQHCTMQQRQTIAAAMAKSMPGQAQVPAS